MKKKIISLFLASVIFSTFAQVGTFATGEVEKIVLYVSPTGGDSNPGTIEKPLKTLEGARNKVRQLKGNADVPVEVIFRGGEYRFSQTVNFGMADSGSKENPIVYKAYEGEDVQFKGSVEVDATKGKMVTNQKILSRL